MHRALSRMQLSLWRFLAVSGQRYVCGGEQGVFAAGFGLHPAPETLTHCMPLSCGRLPAG